MTVRADATGNSPGADDGQLPNVWRFWRAPVPLRWLLPVYFGLFAATVVAAFLASVRVTSTLWGLCGVALVGYGFVLITNINGCAGYVAAVSRTQRWGGYGWFARTPTVRLTAVGFVVLGGLIAFLGLTGRLH